MKRLLWLAVLGACGGHDDPPADRWADVQKLAEPTVPPGAAVPFMPILAGVDTANDVPGAALDAMIAWAKAGGGLPWREQAAPSATAAKDSAAMSMRASRVGNAIIAQRPNDPDAVGAALYFAWRTRAEGATLIDETIGVVMADRIRALHAALPPSALEIKYAPTDAEIRRGLAVEGVTVGASLGGSLAADVHADYQAYLVDAPADPAGFLANFDAVRAAAEIHAHPLLTQKRIVHQLFDQVAAYRAWLAAAPKH